MLDLDALQQLKGLKKQIRDSRDIRTGRYRPARNRFGFVTDDNGDDVFLPPDEAMKLLPGDEVEIEVFQTEDNRQQGKILKLLGSEFKQCFGTVVERGKGFFVQIDNEHHLWMFVPPKNRRGAKDGDRVSASLLKHPYKNEGKGQVRIDEVIGNLDLAGVETAYAVACHGLHTDWPKETEGAVSELVDSAATVTEGRTASKLPFVTIDSASTRDLDDAVYCQSIDNGWHVAVAIADPVSVIKPHSLFDKAAKKRGATVYFPHGPKPMLPEELSANSLSLMPNVLRPAVVLELDVSASGELSNISFSLQSIRSVAKLSYFQVDDYISHGTICEELTDTIQHSLAAAKMVTDVLRGKRDSEALLNDNRQEFRLRLNDSGKVEDIVEIERTPAHELVEELMLLCNTVSAKFLTEKSAPGPFSVHSGIRAERIKEAQRLIKDFAPDFPQETDIESLDGFKAIKQACQAPEAAGLIRPLRRLLARAVIQNEPGAHFGLGLDCYTTMTSPLRRYQDLAVHFQLYQVLENEQVVPMHNDQLEKLSELLLKNRMAVRQAESDLLAQHAAKLKDKVFDAEIVQLNNKQVTVRCCSNGVVGIIPSSSLGKKWKYDALRGKLSNDAKTLILGDKFRVSIDNTDTLRRQIQFKVVAGE